VSKKKIIAKQEITLEKRLIKQIKFESTYFQHIIVHRQIWNEPRCFF